MCVCVCGVCGVRVCVCVCVCVCVVFPVAQRTGNGQNVFQERIFSSNSACCHTETFAEDQTCYLIQPRYVDTVPAIPSPDPITSTASVDTRKAVRFKSGKTLFPVGSFLN